MTNWETEKPWETEKLINRQERKTKNQPNKQIIGRQAKRARKEGQDTGKKSPSIQEGDMIHENYYSNKYASFI